MNVRRNKQEAALATVQTGTTGSQGDKMDRILWAEEIFAAAPLQNRLFMNVAGLTLDQTNNTEPGRMPSNRKLIVHAIVADYVSETTGGIKATAADIQAFYTQLARTTVALMINNREFGQWTLQRLLGASLLVAVNPAVTFNPPFLYPDFKGITPLNNPREIAGNTQYYLEVTHTVAPTAATIGDRLRLGLMGTEIRVN